MSAKAGDAVINELSTFFLTRDAWQNWTPTINQGGAVARTVNYAHYVIIGDTVHIEAEISPTAAGAAGNVIIVGGLPAAIGFLHFGAVDVVGKFVYYDNGTAFYEGGVLAQTATTIIFQCHGVGSQLGATPNFAIANGDILGFNLTYRR